MPAILTATFRRLLPQEEAVMAIQCHALLWWHGPELDWPKAVITRCVQEFGESDAVEIQIQVPFVEDNRDALTAALREQEWQNPNGFGVILGPVLPMEWHYGSRDTSFAECFRCGDAKALTHYIGARCAQVDCAGTYMATKGDA